MRSLLFEWTLNSDILSSLNMYINITVGPKIRVPPRQYQTFLIPIKRKERGYVLFKERCLFDHSISAAIDAQPDDAQKLTFMKSLLPIVPNGILTDVFFHHDPIEKPIYLSFTARCATKLVK